MEGGRPAGGSGGAVSGGRRRVRILGSRSVRAVGLDAADGVDDAGGDGARRLQQRHRSQGQGAQARTEGGREQAKDQTKDLAKAKSEYEKSLKDFKKAADLAPSLYQAYNGMGFAYRKIGDYTKSLEMYDKALALQPGFPDAIEYRAEAYLALNRVDDAKQAYLELFASDRKQADILMKAMTDWVTGRHADPAGVDPAAFSGFESWIKERSALAGQTASMALAAQHETWR